MSTLTITEFLEARIAEDEAMARAVAATVAPDAWENPTRWGNFFPEDITFYDTQTPYRVLAECAAKREIVAVQSLSKIAAIPNPFVLRALATVYKDHPDYRQEWAL